MMRSQLANLFYTLLSGSRVQLCSISFEFPLIATEVSHQCPFEKECTQQLPTFIERDGKVILAKRYHCDAEFNRTNGISMDLLLCIANTLA